MSGHVLKIMYAKCCIRTIELIVLWYQKSLIQKTTLKGAYFEPSLIFKKKKKLKRYSCGPQKDWLCNFLIFPKIVTHPSQSRWHRPSAISSEV